MFFKENSQIISLFSLIIFLTAICALFFNTKPAEAWIRCKNSQGIDYICAPNALSVEKTVWDPSKRSYVQNMTKVDHLFKPGDEVLFKIKVENIGTDKLLGVTIRDSLPSDLYLTSNSTSIRLGDLNPGQKEERTLTTRLRDKNSLSNSNQIFCIRNSVDVTETRIKDPQTSQICIDNRKPSTSASREVVSRSYPSPKQVNYTYTPPKIIPVTGPAEWLAILGAIPALSFVGLKLRQAR